MHINLINYGPNWSNSTLIFGCHLLVQQCIVCSIVCAVFILINISINIFIRSQTFHCKNGEENEREV